METLEELGFIKDTSVEFCPSIEYMEYTNKEKRIIFWKNKAVQIFTDDGRDIADFSFKEIQACAEMINRMGW